MTQLSLFTGPVLSPSEQLRLERARQQQYQDQCRRKRSALQDQWGGFWGAQFIDGRSVFGPGTNVYLLGGKALKIARVEAQPGQGDYARLTCLYLGQEEYVPLEALTDKFLTSRKTDVFIPRALFSDQSCAEMSLTYQQQRDKSLKQNKPWSIAEIRTLAIEHFKTKYSGIANQVITDCQNYQDDFDLARPHILENAEEVQMKLITSCRKYDPDYFITTFYQVVDEIAANHTRTATHIQIG